MKRIALWFLSTVTVVVLLFGYHTSTSGVTDASASTSIIAGGIAAATTQRSASEDVPSPAPTSTASGATTSTPTATSPKTSTTTPTTTPTTPTTTTPTTTTVTGTAVDTRYGPVQVVITVTGSQVTNVAVPTYPTSEPKDAEINGYALPVLIQETLDAQSAQIAMVSGATFTSEGYLQSLQSALDQAGI